MHNVVLQEQMDEIVNTTGANLKYAYIRADIEKSFTGANFSGATFHDIKMKDATFTECDFSGATIRADITNARFVRCNFENATFQHTHIFDCEMKENNFQQALFVRSSIRQTELSGNNFLIMQMQDVKMSDISIREFNDHTDTIRFGLPGGTREEVEKMKDHCIDELSGVAEVYRQSDKVKESQWDKAVEEALETAMTQEPEFEMEM
ncbi:MAG: pentapeptide repeat-containing protein [Lachnospiraceae bacterium]|nr:pentapeptide repeat-containing protein [Lachnospiraceae bacterium]